MKINRRHTKTMPSLKGLFLATRPWSFTMSWVSVALGGLIAWQDGKVSLAALLLTALGATLVHGATNAVNDFFDTRYGVDTSQAPTARYRPHPIFTGLLSPRALLWEALVLYGIAGAIGLALMLRYSLWVFWIGLVGFLTSFLYTARPVAAKYRALGEISVFLAWGPLMIQGAYAVQRNGLSIKAFWVSLPIGLLVALVLFANNARDIAYDASRNIQTAASLLGKQKSLRAFIALIALAYLLVVAMVPLGVLSPFGLLVFFSIPAAIKLVRGFLEGFPDAADALTARLNLAFGSLLCLALFLEGITAR
jgi:1,4-dihydroxy-2-naphthoate octaprenyltransferase